MQMNKGKIKSIILLSTLLMTGCQMKQVPYSEQHVVTVGEDKIYLDEMMYHIMITEFQGKLISSYLGNEADYWNSEYESGTSMREEKQKEILENAIKYEIYYDQACKEGLTLNETENKQVHEIVKSIQQNISKEQIEATHLSEEALIEITAKKALATKYYNEQFDLLSIDQKAIASKMNEADDLQYTIQYLFMPTWKKDTKGNLVALEDKEIQAQYEKMQHYKIQLQEEQNIDQVTILKEDEQKVQKGEISFSQNKHPFENEIELVEETKKLKEQEISEVFETCKGYYVILKLEGEETSRQKALDQAVQQEKEAQLEKQYEVLKENYSIYINEKVWDKIHIGNMTEE